MLSLYVSLCSYKYETLEGDLVYMPIMDMKSGCDNEIVYNKQKRTDLFFVYCIIYATNYKNKIKHVWIIQNIISKKIGGLT
jgi:hypothetical protein